MLDELADSYSNLGTDNCDDIDSKCVFSSYSASGIGLVTTKNLCLT
jgi:hypothetical protein